MSKSEEKVDVCLLLEGTYPYVPGGVSTWTHDLILNQKHLKFHIIAMLPPGAKHVKHYKIPNNVVKLQTIHLQELPRRRSFFAPKNMDRFFESIESPFLNLLARPDLKYLKNIMTIINQNKEMLSSNVLLNSEESWKMQLRMYNSMLGDTPFIDFFWSWRALFAGFYSVLLIDLPDASVYHSLCTGYAGLLLARAHIEKGKPCLVTEHGIYTNERKIEISSADWLDDGKSHSLSIKKDHYEKELRDFWVDTFSCYSKLCYEASSHIITLYKGNQKFQILDGADENKLKIIPNGIDYKRFSAIERINDKEKKPVIALIGRVVPIKDIKTFIRACGVLKNTIVDFDALILGPRKEDQDYYEECVELVDHLGLEDVITFTGKVKIDDYLPKIDINVLTSISEAQPLVLLEVGAAGIPSVVTDVGSCKEIIEGLEDEIADLGQGGAVCPLSNPAALAAEILPLLVDKEHYKTCSDAIRARVKEYYTKEKQHTSYSYIYDDLIAKALVRQEV